MNNKYLRLFVAQTRIMTAEKMRLDRFCQHGEYFAYKIALPPDPSFDLETADDVKFIFSVNLENELYYFTNDNISDKSFAQFEWHMSTYLNVLFKRKMDFEARNEMFNDVMRKLLMGLTLEEQRCLATNIDANMANVLHALGVEPDI